VVPMADKSALRVTQDASRTVGAPNDPVVLTGCAPTAAAQPDLRLIRETAVRLLDYEAAPPRSTEIEDLHRVLRGDVTVLIPLVQDAFGRDHPQVSQVVASARRQLDLPGPEPGKERLQLVRLATSAQLLLELIAPEHERGLVEGTP
jgi:hypothetical protein